MEVSQRRPKYVIGPDGGPLTIADLPAPGMKRWVIRRKAQVVAAVRGGLLSIEEACAAVFRRALRFDGHAAWLVREHRFDHTPFDVAWSVPHDSNLQFGSLNHSQRNVVNSEPASPKLPANQANGGHRRIDASD